MPHGQVRGSLLECKNAFHAEILTPSACYTILSRLRSRRSHPLHVFSLAEGGGLKLAREGTRWASERRKREERREHTAASQATPGLIHVVPVARRGVSERGFRVGGRWSARGTPRLGSRRGVVITSRSDRVPLLSRRHTPAEKQNGTSDRPTDRPTLLPSLPFPPSEPSSLSLVSFSGRDFDLEEPSTRRRATRETRSRGLQEPSTSEKPKREKEKRPEKERREEAGESRVPTFSNRPEALEIRFGRLMIGPEDRDDPLPSALGPRNGTPFPVLPIRGTKDTERRSRLGERTAKEIGSTVDI